MKRFLQSTFLAVSLVSSLLPAAAQVRRPYVAIKANVQFKFKVGERSFRAGSYELVSVGTNLMALRDARARIVASLVTRSVESGVVAPSTKVVFYQQKKHIYLAQIKVQDLSQVLENSGRRAGHTFISSAGIEA
jgi:hypothetical protein